MKLRVFGITDRSTLEPLPDATLSASRQEDAATRWIDIEAATEQELGQLLAPLHVPAEILEACLQAERTARFISRPSALYLEVPTHHGWEAAERPYISLLCLKSTIITIHRDRQHTIEDIIREADAEVPLYAQTTSALLYYLLTEIGKCTVEAAMEVRALAEQLDQACHDQPDNLDPDQIAVLRRRVSHYSSVHDDHMYVAGVLQTVESEALRVSEQSQFFRGLPRLSELSGQLIDGAEARVASLQRDYELLLQNRVDNRLRFLTILSAVLLPLSLISGIYGMNFDDLPGMGTPHGYIIVIGMMLATAGLIAWYLLRRGWFE